MRWVSLTSFAASRRVPRLRPAPRSFISITPPHGEQREAERSVAANSPIEHARDELATHAHSTRSASPLGPLGKRAIAAQHYFG